MVSESETTMERVQVMIPGALVTALDKYRQGTGQNRSELIRDAIVDWLTERHALEKKNEISAKQSLR